MNDDLRLDQLLGETLQLMAESGVTTTSNAVALGKFASQYHERMAKTLKEFGSSSHAPLDPAVEAAVNHAVERTLNTAVPAILDAVLQLRASPGSSKTKIITLFSSGKKTSVSVQQWLYDALRSRHTSREIVTLSEKFALSVPVGTSTSQWVAKSLENHLVLKTLQQDATAQQIH